MAFIYYILRIKKQVESKRGSVPLQLSVRTGRVNERFTDVTSHAREIMLRAANRPIDN